jgi:hypothetical protein
MSKEDDAPQVEILLGKWGEALSERELHVLRRYYGINTDRATLQQIGQDLGISGTRVRQIRVGAEVKIGFRYPEITESQYRKWQRRRREAEDKLSRSLAARERAERRIRLLRQEIEMLDEQMNQNPVLRRAIEQKGVQEAEAALG